jgi:hypothetical protein
LPPVHRRVLESPALATYIIPLTIKQTLAVHPAFDSLGGSFPS